MNYQDDYEASQATTFKHDKLWKPEEDILIILLVQNLGLKKWNQVAEEIRDRMPTSIRTGK